ncbi:hypothetical protein GCM10009765_83400 [Fodinicola feengrottensis]|uniref:Uncharacterized protein n=1 Tax=Fodinicola feengrottensis TaxID=435914 RepID=A0ABN2JCX6_9ACTN
MTAFVHKVIRTLSTNATLGSVALLSDFIRLGKVNTAVTRWTRVRRGTKEKRQMQYGLCSQLPALSITGVSLG